MKTGVEKIIQAKGGDAPAKNQTGVQKIIELLGGDPPAKNQTGVDKIVEILEGGGGNPNRVQTITGTMATITDDMIEQISMTPDEFFAAIDDNNANVILTVDATALGAGIDKIDFPVHCYGSDQLYAATVQAHWNNSGVYFDAAFFLNIDLHIDHYELSAMASIDGTGEATDLLSYASLLPYTLTIIWHPLPDNG